jgi:hypothetical protein
MRVDMPKDFLGHVRQKIVEDRLVLCHPRRIVRVGLGILGRDVGLCARRRDGGRRWLYARSNEGAHMRSIQSGEDLSPPGLKICVVEFFVGGKESEWNHGRGGGGGQCERHEETFRGELAL